MNLLRLKIIMGCWLVLGLLGFGARLVCAATVEMEYRFERMVPHMDLPWQVSGRIAIGSDGTFWIYDGYVRHFNADGTLIGVIDKKDLRGMALAQDGSLWVTQGNGSSYAHILHFDANHNVIGQFGSFGNEPGQFFSPKDIAVATDGSLWILDSGNHRIQHFTSDGTFIGQIGNLSIFGEIGAIATAADGSLWVADYIFSGSFFSGSTINRIHHFQMNGDYISVVNTPSKHVTDITLAADASLWILALDDHNNSCIQHVQTNGNLIEQFCNAKGVPFNSNLNGIAIAADGSLWVTAGDAYNRYYRGVDDRRIMHLQSNGTLISQFPYDIGYDIGSTISRLNHRIGIAVANNGDVWTTDSGANCILHFDATGALIGQFGSQGSAEGQFSNPAGIALASDGSLWVVDSGNYRLQHLNADGKFLQQIQTPKLINRGDDGPSAIAVARDGGVWITLPEANQILHYHANGSLLKQFETYDQSASHFSSPSGIAVAADDSIWVTEKERGRIQHYQANGTFINQFGSPGSAAGQFSYPIGITVAANGSLWVADAGNYRIQNLDTNGIFIGELGFLGSGVGQFNAPVNIALAPDGAIWVKDNQVSAYGGRYNKIIGKHNRLQKFILRSKSATPHPYKAILLASGGKKAAKLTNPLWEGVWQVTQKASKALQFQGFKAHEEILFLTAGDTQLDLDDDNQPDDLQTATKDSLHQAITDWAKDSTDVVLFLANPTSDGQFQINATETLSATELSAWLAELEKNLPVNGKVTVVIESPDAGSFLSALANPTRPRIVIASTQAGQPALLSDHGVNSFSYSFWSRVMNGAPLAEAFLAGQQAISPFVVNGRALQPVGDTNGDGQTDGQDAAAVGNYCLGMCNKTAAQLPVINLPRQPSLLFNATSSLDFYVNIKPSASTNLLEAWALVQRPTLLNADPANALSLEKVPLNCNARQQCTGRYQNFNTPGQYRVHFYALDSQYQLNEPVSMDITIQSANPSALPAEYDNRQDLLTLRDVEVGGQHYQAALQYQDGLYHLLTLGLTSYLSNLAAIFDVATNLLDIPSVRVNGRDYQASFKLVDNYLFELLHATLK